MDDIYWNDGLVGAVQDLIDDGEYEDIAEYLPESVVDKVTLP